MRDFGDSEPKFQNIIKNLYVREGERNQRMLVLGSYHKSA